MGKRKDDLAASTKRDEVAILATGLIQTVINKSTSIKKRLDEGGLIDWVVDSLSANAESTRLQSLNGIYSSSPYDDYPDLAKRVDRYHRHADR